MPQTKDLNSLGSGGQTAEIQVSQSHVPSESLRGALPASCNVWRLLGVLGLQKLVTRLHHFPPRSLLLLLTGT